MRSLLSLLGLTVAILGMVGLFSVAEGIDAMVHKTFNIIPGLAVLQPGAPIPIFSRLPESWAREIETMDGVHVVDAEIWSRAHIIEDQPVMAPPRFLFGTDIPNRNKLRYSVYHKHLIEGRFLTEDDIGSYRTVISKPIADEFEKRVGDILLVDGQELEIVGIYFCDSLLLDVAIILDIGVLRPLARMEGSYVSAFYVEPDEGVDRDKLAQQMEERFIGRKAPQDPSLAMISTLQSVLTSGPAALFSNPRKSPRDKKTTSSNANRKDQPNLGSAPVQSKPKSDAGGTTPDQSAVKKHTSGIEVRGSDDWAKEFKRFSADLDIFLVVLTSIGVTIAVLSIVNTMLMSVTERFIEFGILKANGWTNRNVLFLITFESAILGVSGGILGSSLGWLATIFINANWPERIHLHASPQLLLFGVFFSATLGILGGLYPAIWASRMMPMDAIRRG